MAIFSNFKKSAQFHTFNRNICIDMYRQDFEVVVVMFCKLRFFLYLNSNDIIINKNSHAHNVKSL